jgi:hypothetical protein
MTMKPIAGAPTGAPIPEFPGSTPADPLNVLNTPMSQMTREQRAAVVTPSAALRAAAAMPLAAERSLQAFIEKLFQVDRTPRAFKPRVTWARAEGSDYYQADGWDIRVKDHARRTYVQIGFTDPDRISLEDGKHLMAVIRECEARSIEYNTYYDGDFDALSRRWWDGMR